MFKFLWKATFKGKVICQHPDDKYSKFDPEASYNPSSFRDFLDYFEKKPDELIKFELVSPTTSVIVELDDHPSKPCILMDAKNKWGTYTKKSILHSEKRVLKDVRIIYYREMEAPIKDGVFGEPKVKSFVVGYQGLDENGNNRQKTVSVI